MAVGAISLWQLAHFCCGSWRVFVVAVGAFLLWQLAQFCCGSWRVFVVTVGVFSLWQLVRFRCDSWRNFVVAVGAILLGNIYASLPKNVFETNRKGAFWRHCEALWGRDEEARRNLRHEAIWVGICCFRLQQIRKCAEEDAKHECDDTLVAAKLLTLCCWIHHWGRSRKQEEANARRWHCRK